MYKAFFGFKENPFKLVPNPAYLFLSKSHEEALAYLNYAISQGDGFVELTGEPGTGKTTLCRAFLESLDESITAAYIFNPKLSPNELLKAINDELGIDHDTESTKDLIDRLNSFLLQEKEEHKSVLILIDEAQNLSRDVLEQLRLLSNLETNNDKLLQIILVGQPELSQLLDSYELRQISQRINLRYRISPLGFKEAQEYIQHRLNIAAQKAIGFDHSAYWQVYRYSKGIPRIINIACDRALLTAFCLNQKKITGSIAKTAIRELSSHGRLRNSLLFHPRKALLVFPILCVLLAGFIYYRPLLPGVNGRAENLQKQHGAADGLSSKSTAMVNTTPSDFSVKEKPQPNAAPVAMSDFLPDLPEILIRTGPNELRRAAIKNVLDLWHVRARTEARLEDLDDDQAYFRLSAKANGFMSQRLDADLDLLKSLNIPAILELRNPNNEQPIYLTLRKIDGQKVLFEGIDEKSLLETEVGELQHFWTGTAYVLWKNYLAIKGTIPAQSDEDSTIALKLLLQDLGFGGLKMNSDYDEPTRKAIEEVQAKYHLKVDGLVGPLTKIILYRESNAYDMPRIIGID